MTNPTEPLRRTAGGIPRFQAAPQPAARAPILTTAQAEAVYGALCAINNVGGTIGRMSMPTQAGRIIVQEGRSDGAILCLRVARQGNPAEQIEVEEEHASQAAFATAYSLNTGA